MSEAGKKPTVFISYSHKDEQESLSKAKAMIERMGYHRRDKDVKEIERQL